MTDAIKLEGVSVEQLQLLDDKVLVRVLPREEVRASGLFVLHGAPEHQVGAEFYGEVVAVGPGSLVREGPPAEAVANVAAMAAVVHRTDPKLADLVKEAVSDFLEKHKAMRRVPPPWKAGDQVLVKQGFGVEIDLREGRHHVVERAGKFGHGILAAWSKDHTHCWHLETGEHYFPPGAEKGGYTVHAECCGCHEGLDDLETRLPGCQLEGPRLAEAVLGGKHVYDVKIPSVPKPQEFDPERPGGFSVGELRPE